MSLQDIIAYSLAAIMVFGIAYLAWAGRQEKHQIKDPKDKSSKS